MIAFNKYYNKFNILSVSLVIVSLLLLTFKGLNFGIDFKGGTLIELRSSDTKINVSSLRDNLSQMNLGDVSVKKFGNDQDYLVKFETLILLSDDLNSINVPPLKSIPKFNPLNNKKSKEITTSVMETILKWL